MTLPELLELVGADNINFQMLHDAMSNISDGRKCSKITFETQALNATNVAANTGPVGLVVWCDREAWLAALPKKGDPA